MQLYQVFFVISFLQTLNQYQTSKSNKPEQQTDKSCGGERSQTQTGGFRESKIKGMLKRTLTNTTTNIWSLQIGAGDSNIIMPFDFYINSEKNKKSRQRDSNGNPIQIVFFTQNIENFSSSICQAEFRLEKNNNSWGLYFNNDLIFEPETLSTYNNIEYVNEAVNTFNDTYMLFMGYVITIEGYENLLKSVRPYVQNEKSDLLYINDQLEAQVNYNRGSFELNHRSPSVKIEQGSNSESLDIINESLDGGGNIMDTIFGEENSEKYEYSLAGNGELYQYFARLANTTSSFFDENNFYFEQPWINNQDADEMIGSLLSFLGEQSNVSIATGGGKPKKAKKTKKKRKQKKHTKKLKYRKKSTKSPRKTEKKRK